MNKKIFTLLASLLMLFLTAFVVNAQLPYYGSAVTNLPKGTGEGAYLLQVTHYGHNLGVTYPGTPFSGISEDYYRPAYLSMDAHGKISLVSPDSIINATYKGLRSALWCVDVADPEKDGTVPTYEFLNKEHSALLSVDTGNWTGSIYGDIASIPGTVSTNGTISNPAYPLIRSQVTRGATDIYVDGYYTRWAFSSTYNTTPLEQGVPLKLEIDGEKDYFMTFAYTHASYTLPYTSPHIELVKVHARDLDPTYNSFFYQNYLVFFRLVTAAPRVLSKTEFNTMIGERATEDYTTLQFDPETRPVDNNVLAQPLLASTAYSFTSRGGLQQEYYLNLKTQSGDYIYVADGDDDANYYNPTGKRFAILKQGALTTNGRSDFRLVYYPSEDNIVINVRRMEHIDDVISTYRQDDITAPVRDIGNGFYSDEIADYLIVKLQDLVEVVKDDGRTVITVYDVPTHTRIHFGIRGCIVSDDRTTVPANLYVIRDELGRYLVMPLEVGDFTPRWLYLEEWEKPLKTPSYQWLIHPSNKNSEFSPVFFTNREFSWVSIDPVQIYTTPTSFKGYWGSLGGNFANISDVNAKIYYVSDEDSEGFQGSFKIVKDDPDVAAAVIAGIDLTQEQWQRRYRTSPYMGYKFISTDSLNYYGYAFNYLTYLSPNYFLYTPEENRRNSDATKDTMLYVAQNKNYFQLLLPDTLMAYGAEKYGIGYVDSLLTWPDTKDIAKLVRYYYYIQQNDYWNFAFADNFIALDRNGRYVFADEYDANANPLKKAKFYLRFTYQPDNKKYANNKPNPIAVDNAYPEYYTLLNRINHSDFHYVNQIIGLQILDTLKEFDASHNAYATTGYGVVSASVNDGPTAASLFVRAQTKTAGATRVSTFALSTVTEPLYRRFDNILADDCETPAGEARDYPRTLKFFTTRNPKWLLYEDQYSTNAYGKTCMNCPPFVPYSGNGINFLGLENEDQHFAKVAQNINHPSDPWHNYSIYVDTAYVNRGTGHIKPQYLLGVGVKFYNGECTKCGIELPTIVYARWLKNATDSARIDPNNMTSKIRDNAYIWEDKWERLEFKPGLHIEDTLLLFNVLASEVDEFLAPYMRKDDNDKDYIDYVSLYYDHNESKTGLVHMHMLDNNLHKDYVFSMRFYEKGNYEDFLLESETTHRSATQGRMIAPMNGGWVRNQNWEMVISRGSYYDAILEAERWNTVCEGETPEHAVGNDAIAAVKVFAGDGSVTILNAAGKQILISNVLGQTVAKTVLTSDYATIDAPKGVLVVAVEGENAVKAVVK